MIYRMLAIVAVVVLTGCTGAVKKPTMEEQPEPEPLPTLAGTWRSTSSFIEDGRTLTEVILLTLIGERFIESVAQYDAEGQTVSDGHNQGGWAADDAMIEKRWHPGEDGSVAKKYYWGDARRSVLFVECWTCDHQEQYFTKLERVPDAMPVADLFGTWMLTEDGGEATWTLTITPDATFSLKRVEGDGIFHISGRGTVDLDNYFINLTELTRHREDREDTPWWDGVGRAAFAPAPDGGIRVSWPWHEPPIMNARAESDEDVELEPYGSYWMLFKKVEQ